MKEYLAFGVSMFALLCVVSHCTGCVHEEKLPVESALAVAQYDHELVAKCQAEARIAKSVDVFDACELRVRKEFCRASEALRRAWERCAEVTP